MEQARFFRAIGFAVMAAALAAAISAQVGDPATLVQEKLVSQIKVTKAAADHSDIVTAGDVVLLHKDGLMMCSSASSYGFSNTYNNGVLVANYNNRAKDAAKSFFKGHLPFGGGGSVTDAANNGCPSRKFVAGEKFWITGIAAQKDGILISTFSDPYPDPSGNQVRYYGEVKFLFPKGSVPPPDDFARTVSELITVQPPDDKDNGGQGNQGGQPAQARSGAAAPGPGLRRLWPLFRRHLRQPMRRRRPSRLDRRRTRSRCLRTTDEGSQAGCETNFLLQGHESNFHEWKGEQR